MTKEERGRGVIASVGGRVLRSMNGHFNVVKSAIHDENSNAKGDLAKSTSAATFRTKNGAESNAESWRDLSAGQHAQSNESSYNPPQHLLDADKRDKDTVQIKANVPETLYKSLSFKKREWSFTEQFTSQDDVNVDDILEVGNAQTNHGAASSREKSIWESTSTLERAPSNEETGTNTIMENQRLRGNKASRASNVGAFVTFLKALFGIGMLSNPAVLGEVGLILGTICHLLIVFGCAFSCYLLLSARQYAKYDILAKQRDEAERKEDYRMWQEELASRAVASEIKAGHPLANPTSSLEETSGKKVECNGLSDDILVDDWTVAPVPLERVHSSNVHPEEVCGRLEDAALTIPSACRRSSPLSDMGSDFSCTDSCAAVEMTKQTRRKSGNFVQEAEEKHQPKTISDRYHRFSDRQFPGMPECPKVKKSPPVRLVTYGDVAKYLAGKKASFFIIFTITAVHVLFASGMVHLAVENLCYVVGWERLGWSYVEYEDDGGRRLGPSGDENHASRSSDEEEYYLEWRGPDFTGRLAMASLLFPIIQGLLQIPSLTELVTISSIGLLTYAVGCVGSMLYTAVVLTEGHPFVDHPDDMWATKWSGVPTYVATTIYCIEGINLALPTVSSLEGARRWNTGLGSTDGDRSDLSVYVVVGAVVLYGVITLIISWLGLAGGLGGGVGTIHGEDGCWDVTYCLNSSAVRFVYMLSLGVALVLTLPVILYPSTEMLEVWLDERDDERRKRKEESQPDYLKWKRRSLIDDATLMTNLSRDASLSLRGSDVSPNGGKPIIVSPSCVQEPSPVSASGSLRPSPRGGGDNPTSAKPRRKLKYWKLRMFLAATICIIGTIEGSFPHALKVAEIIRGIGLSIAGLIFPPLLYMCAIGGNFSMPMAASMSLLIGLGFFNIILILISAFGNKDFIIEDGRGNYENYYEM
mmetsp:Transcript_13285/g.30528  ORF Transcript_13285/g.30528 Transcript_13285/m.30528 type:complete len:927 (-) Transcript_13285:103-2883(-)